MFIFCSYTRRFSFMVPGTKVRMAETSLYISIGGVANQKAILRVKGLLPVVLAVDNDCAGDECRKRNPDIPSIMPVCKDWNEDLQKLTRS